VPAVTSIHPSRARLVIEGRVDNCNSARSFARRADADRGLIDIQRALRERCKVEHATVQGNEYL
jgi:hypothetical protein